MKLLVFTLTNYPSSLKSPAPTLVIAVNTFPATALSSHPKRNPEYYARENISNFLLITQFSISTSDRNKYLRYHY